MNYLNGCDVDFYNNDTDTPQKIDFNKMKNAGAGFVFVRVGQNEWPDPDFSYNWFEAKKAKLPRGGYWFYDSRVSPEGQAILFVQQFNGDYGELPFICDFEETYNGQYKGYGNFKKFIEKIRVLVPGKEIGIYTGFYYWKDTINVPASEKPYFSQFPLWIAGYKTDKPLIPDTWKDWLFWQYTDSGDGKLYGAESKGIDLNYFNGDLNSFNKRFNLTNGQPENIPDNKLLEQKEYFQGVVYKKYQKNTNHGLTIYHVMEVDVDKVDFFVSPQLQSRKYVPDYLDAFNLDFAVNGDGFISTTIAGYASSEGKAYGKLGIEETTYISKDSNFSITRVLPIWNAISHPNRLVISGKIVPINKSLDDIRARTSWGYTKDQKKVFFMWCDGADYAVKQGFNFVECAEILLALGCDFGFMQDGGGSTTAAIRENNLPKILGVPYGEDEVIRYPGYKLRRVANALGFRVKNKTNTPTETPVTEKKVTIEYSDKKYITNNISRR